MTPKEFVDQYIGKKTFYGKELTENAEAIAKEYGLVVIFGASDDICEIKGAIEDSIDCYNGGKIYIGKSKDILFEGELADEIEIVWSDCDEPSWHYETAIPHESFLVYDNEDLYCRGIVFSLEDIKERKRKNNYLIIYEEEKFLCEEERHYNVRAAKGIDDALIEFADSQNVVDIELLTRTLRKFDETSDKVQMCNQFLTHTRIVEIYSVNKRIYKRLERLQ